MPARDGPSETAGCVFPDELFYDVQNHIWYAPLADGAWRIGMTMVAVAMANHRIFAFTPRRVGRPVERGKSCATIESSKWIGPVRIAFDGVVEAVNEAAQDRPSLIVTDPYGQGWMMVARASGPVEGLLQGEDLRAAYARWMQTHDFRGCARPIG